MAIDHDGAARERSGYLGRLPVAAATGKEWRASSSLAAPALPWPLGLSLQVELRADEHADSLVQASHDAQALFLAIPVERSDGLSRKGLLLQKLHLPKHTFLVPVLLLYRSLCGVRVLPQLERSIAAACHKDVAILWQMPARPDSTLMRSLRQKRVAMHRMVRAHIVQPVPGLKRGHDKLVHRNVLAIELNSAHAIGDVCFPPNLPGCQVEEFDVAIVIPCTDHSIICRVCIAEAHCPAVTSNRTFFRLHACDWSIFLPGVPHVNAAIPATCDDFGRACTLQPSAAIDAVDDSFVCLRH
mmetsp:Transcript_16718/g.42951  ORF Transcript_16718/g.42951 Transcript_16718/m.42951 type:complete len:299 (+) Transcript_16718:286-1182(+)